MMTSRAARLLLAALAALGAAPAAADDGLDMAKMYFGMLDTDADGKVSRPELDTFVTNMMAMSGVPDLADDPALPAMIDTAFAMSDADKSGFVSLEEAAVTQEEITKMVGAFMAEKMQGADL